MADEKSDNAESKSVSDREIKPDAAPVTRSTGDKDSPSEPLRWVYRQIHKRFGMPGVLIASVVIFLLGTIVISVTGQSVGPVSCRTTKPLPHVDSKAFTLVIAKLDLDETNRYQRLIVEAMDGFAGVQILPIDRTIGLSDGTLHDSVRAGRNLAQEYLRETGADVLVWGVVLHAPNAGRSSPKALRNPFSRY